MGSAESVGTPTANLTISLIRLYQRFLSPFTGNNCRFYPSCSEYSIQAINKYGLIKGSLRSSLRILKCHPFHPGGYDPLI
ncbi:MAG: membrane protein insertion efficiency factor YidD [Geobacteraceae bacterium]|nr:membrane protein insertion efficiency factor YidD [Geobacteraceae bacterium]